MKGNIRLILRRLKHLIPSLATSVAILAISVGCGSSQSSSGVATIDESRPRAIQGVDQVDISQLTDEEITTLFTDCMRDNGYDVSDPKLNPDGTIDFQALRANFMQVVGDAENPRRARAGVEACRPVLAGATFAQPPSDEDQIELQDRLLRLAQCLRDKGIDVPDPDFSAGPRASIQRMFQQANVNIIREQETIQSCTQAAFSGFSRG